MKASSIFPYTFVLGFSLLVCGIATGESPPDRTAKRPKFTSKIHIPVQIAADVTALPPADYQLVFSDEFDSDQIDPAKLNFRLVDKMLSALQRENVSVKNGNHLRRKQHLLSHL